jgi:hypothetical protein
VIEGFGAGVASGNVDVVDVVGGEVTEEVVEVVVEVGCCVQFV